MKKKKIGIIICAAAAICLMGTAAVAAAVLAGRNPLAKGLLGLSEELAAVREELGEDFWTDAVNQIGSENVQAEYSVNIGGMEAFRNITVGLDGELERDMEQKLFGAEAVLSVANLEIAETSLFGTAETLYLQIPSVWEGSVILNAEDIDGQWNGSTVKAGLQLMTGQKLDIDRRINIALFEKYYVNQYRADDFWKANSDKLKTLYENMEVVTVRKAEKRGLLDAGQAQSLEDYVLEDAEGNRIMTTCYLAVLPERELSEIFAGTEVDIKLCVYLDSEKRIVRICTLPGEILKTKYWSGEAALNLTGVEAVTDRMTWVADGSADLSAIGALLSDRAVPFSAESEVKGTITIEKNREEMGSYQVECDAVLSDRGNRWELSFESSVRGERLDTGEKISLDVGRLVVKSQDCAVCRIKGTAEFAPLMAKVEMPAGKEYKIGEMSELDAALFLTECMGNLYKNYGGYLKLLQGF